MKFIEEDVKPNIQEHSLWVEKYRPNKIENYVGNQEIKDSIQKFISNNDIPHLLFHGSAGTGKTTLAKLISTSISCDTLYINASDENNVETVRNKIKNFAANAGFSDLKVIILDEADFLTLPSQSILRNIIETYSATTRFILTCNYLEKIINPLVSRCQSHLISPLSKSDVALRLKYILDKENIKYKFEDIGYIVNTYYPDIRKIINYTQQHTINNELSLSSEQSVNLGFSEIIDILKNETDENIAFQKIRQLVANNEIRQFEELYNVLFSNIDKFAEYKQGICILIIAEYVYQSSLVVNKEITFMACIYKLLEALK